MHLIASEGLQLCTSDEGKAEKDDSDQGEGRSLHLTWFGLEDKKKQKSKNSCRQLRA